MYVPFVVTHYSLQVGLSKPENIAKRMEKLGLPGCILADNTLSGYISFSKAIKKVGKKPVLGYRVHVTDDIKNKEKLCDYEIILIARNLAGWKELLKLVAQSNHPDNWQTIPRLAEEVLHDVSENLICINTTPLILDDAEYLHGCFEDNFYIGTGEDYEIRDGNKKIKRIALSESYYPAQEDALDHRILLCSKLKTSFDYVYQKLVGDNAWLGKFFDDDRWYIKSYEQVKDEFSEIELSNTLELFDKCEEIEPPTTVVLPDFSCPNNLSPDEYLRQLCREGWKEKIQGKIPPEKIDEYTERIKYELEVLQGAGLSSYFLIVRDILEFCHKKGWMTGVRGSAYGCFVSYLIGITDLDPVFYNLLFERFYNSGRAGSYPDIDMDIPTFAREPVLQYLKEKYGAANVGQIVTFQTLMGRGAIKAVLGAYGKTSPAEMNMITENIIEKAKIADELQEMKDRGEEPSVIRWALENKSDAFREYCYIDEEDNLQGPLAKRFEQAIRLEGTKVVSSRHAGGIVIAPETLDTYVPMILDQQHMALMCGLEMGDAEAAGLIKLDSLGLNFLNKVMGAVSILRYGDINAQ